VLSRTLTRVAAAALLAAAAYAGVPAAPAAAAGCTSAHGVTVVVDFHELGGGVQSTCVLDGGDDYAADLFPTAGFPLVYVQRQPDFVCRVAGLPTQDQDPCIYTPPADAYWSLWWTDEDGGGWTYSALNAGGLRIPDGGYLAFSWSTGSRPVPPGFRAAAHPAPKPTPTPTPEPTKKATPTASATPTATSTPTASASPEPTKKPKPRPSATATPTTTQTPSTTPSSTPSPTPTLSPTPASAETADDDGGLPGWAAPAVIAVLFAGAGGAAVLRRRRTSGS
jgi:hypothetical protein